MKHKNAKLAWRFQATKTTVTKYEKVAQIRNQINREPHLTHATTWESAKKIKHRKREQRDQPFPSRWPQGSNEQTGQYD